MGLRLSRFNIPIEIEGKQQLFNTRSQRLLSGGMTRKLVERGVDGLTIIERKVLHGNGMLLLDDGDECDRLYVEYMRGKQRSTLFSLIVVPAYRCNCACPDCFQREYDHRTMMSEAVRHGVVRLFEHAIVERRAPSPVLWISGGEPFANVRACVEISSGCREAATRCGVKLTQAITTNATLTRTALGRRLARQSDLFYVGMAESESAQAAERPYAGGGNSYRDAVRGIGDMTELGRKVTVRFNISSGAAGIANVKQVIDDIYLAVGGDPVDNLFFEFAPLESQCGTKRCGTSDDQERTPAADADWQIRNADALVALAGSTPWPMEHFLIPQLRPAAAISDDWGDLRLCDYLRGDGVFVAPSGEMFSCMNRAHQAAYALGNVASDPHLFRNDRFLRIINFDPFHDPDCRACHFLPMCLTRCPMRDDGDLVNAHSGCRSKRHAEVMRLAQRITESTH